MKREDFQKAIKINSEISAIKRDIESLKKYISCQEINYFTLRFFTERPISKDIPYEITLEKTDIIKLMEIKMEQFKLLEDKFAAL